MFSGRLRLLFSVKCRDHEKLRELNSALLVYIGIPYNIYSL